MRTIRWIHGERRNEFRLWQRCVWDRMVKKKERDETGIVSHEVDLQRSHFCEQLGGERLLKKRVEMRERKEREERRLAVDNAEDYRTHWAWTGTWES